MDILTIQYSDQLILALYHHFRLRPGSIKQEIYSDPIIHRSTRIRLHSLADIKYPSRFGLATISPNELEFQLSTINGDPSGWTEIDLDKITPIISVKCMPLMSDGDIDPELGPERSSLITLEHPVNASGFHLDLSDPISANAIAEIATLTSRSLQTVPEENKKWFEFVRFPERHPRSELAAET